MYSNKEVVAHHNQSGVRAILSPDYDTDVALLKGWLSSARGAIYFVSGEANYKVYNKLESQFENALENGADIYFLTGPLISIPEKFGRKREQAEREDGNAIIRLTKKNNRVFLFPSETRQLLHYRVFEKEGISMGFEVHELKRGAPVLWVWEKHYEETRARIRDFKRKTKKKIPIRNAFYKYFIFLTDKEIDKLKKWARERNMRPEALSYFEIKEFCEGKS